MALERSTQNRIVQITDAHWASHVSDASFSELISGKEPGHRMADFVDDRTTSLLKIHLDVRSEANSNGSLKKRSMGDAWVRSGGMFNPVNIKSGLQGMNGQPNVVSMQKLLDYVFRFWIDSYYLLIVKFDISARITHKTFLVDLLDWTDFITYDAGPGQIMLREKDFYEAYESESMPVAKSMTDKVESLFALFEKGVESLYENRRKRLERQRETFEAFVDQPFAIDQSDMVFVP